MPQRRRADRAGCGVGLLSGAAACLAELRDHMQPRVAAYRYPRQVLLVDALPTGPTGEMLKREITIPAEQTA